MEDRSRQESPEAAPANDDFYRQLFENARAAIFLLDDGRFVECNPSTLGMFGVAREDIVGCTPTEFSPELQPDGRRSFDAARERMAAALAGEPQYFEWIHRRKDGTLFDAEVSLNRLVVDKRPHLQAIVRDVSARKRSEKLLAQEQMFVETTIEALPGGFFVLDENARFVRLNSFNREKFGVGPDEVAGIPAFRFVHAEDRPAVVAALASVFATGESELEARAEYSPGTISWFHLKARRMLFEGRRYAVAISTDITQHKLAEERLAQALAEVTRLRDRLQAENVYLTDEVKSLQGERAIVGQGPTLRRALEQLDQVAPTDSTVLLLGETGTGKELFATAIHERSRRRDRVMVRVNCAALPATLIESEFFGRERGAFTGALSRQVGRFELASGSTIFLDEIGELPLEAQAKLLRVLQEKQIERLGNPNPISVDVRIVAATNRDLAAEVRAGRFRQDLYYRLNVFPISVPALRERPEDIPALVWRFIEELAGPMGKRIESIPQADMEMLARYNWPGNIRELRNVVERSMIMATGTTMRIPALVDVSPPAAVPPRSHEAERDQITSALKKCGWRVRGASGAAELLGVKPTTLETRMARLGIRRPGSAQRG